MDKAIKLLQELAETTESLLALDFEADDFEDDLLMLQDKQKSLREKLDILSLKQLAASSPEITELLHHCLALERSLVDQFQAHQAEVASELQHIQNGHKARNIYARTYSQHEGYFIDRSK